MAIKSVTRRRVLAAGAAFLVVCAALVFFFPSLMIRLFQDTMVSALSARLGAEIHVEDIAARIVPEPRVIISQTRLSAPGRISATIPSIIAYPDFSRLLSGQILSGRYYVESPQVSLVFSPRSEDERPSESMLFPEEVSERAVNALTLGGKFSGTCTISNGAAVIMHQDHHRRIQIKDIHVVLSRDSEAAQFECRASAPLWEEFFVAGRLTVPEGSGRASLHIRRCLLQQVTEFFFPAAERVRLGAADVEALTAFLGEEGISSHLDLTGRDEPHDAAELRNRYIFRLQKLRAAGTLKDGIVSVAFPEIRFRQPGVTAAAEFLRTNESPRIRCSLSSTTITVDLLKEAAAQLVPDSRLASRLLNIVQAGSFPALTAVLEADRTADLLRADNIRLHSTITDGKIFIPKAELELEEVLGTVTVRGGILESTIDHARLGAITGRDGTATVDLLTPGRPFDVSVRVQSELVHLLPLLKTWVRNMTFLNAVERIQDLQGAATGTFMISGDPQGITASAEVDSFNLRASASGLPFPVRIDNGAFSYSGNRIAAHGLTGAWGASTFSDLTIALQTGDQPLLSISCPGTIRLALQQVYPWVRELAGARLRSRWIPDVQSGTAIFEETQFRTPLRDLSNGTFRFAGHAEAVVFRLVPLNQSVTLTTAAFNVIPDAITFSKAEVRADGSALNGSGRVAGYLGNRRRAEVQFQGLLQQPEIHRILTFVRPDRAVRFAGPVSISAGSVVWGPGETATAAATIIGQQNVEADISFYRESPAQARYVIALSQGGTRASIVISKNRRLFELKAQGELTEALVDGILQENKILSGKVKADLFVRLDLDDLASTTVQGELTGEDIIVPWAKAEGVSFVVQSLDLRAEQQAGYLDHAVVSWQDRVFDLTGSIERSGDHFAADMELITGSLDWNLLSSLIPEGESERTAPERGRPLPIEARLTVRAGEFSYGDFTWDPFYALVSLSRDRTVQVEVTDAELCAIATPGLIAISSEGIEAAFQMLASDANLAPTITCLQGGKKVIGGNYDLTGEIHLARKNGTGPLMNSLDGQIEFQAREGRLHRLGIVGKILTVLSVMDVVQIKLPELFQEGIAYDSILITGQADRGILVCDTITMKGPSLGLAGEGTIDLINKQLDLTILAAPLQRLDRILQYVPLVNTILGGEVVTVPVKVSGDWNNPAVKTAPVSAVRGNVTRIMKNTLNLPLKLIEPLVK
ncbi:MAG TPA: AsmA-like C-terminal domain-containing protein [Thermodesulfobacteriota bacterium]|nr:AsmA-like C-terminal region-containing protein [Deltaproteobacteria bacterium]HNR12092.1 AsmA-like C-terminal domain-containing protein [Thermodesulfobacteriota bacterium]